MLIASGLFLLLLVAAVTDIRSRTIPNRLIIIGLVLLVAGFVAGAIELHPLWAGVVPAFLWVFSELYSRVRGGVWYGNGRP